MSAGVVIVGGGLAGAQTAKALRAGGLEEPIQMICGEAAWPYDRPPLSKEFLAGEAGEADLRLLDEATSQELGIEVLLGTRAASLSPSRHELTLADGRGLAYDHLVVATGATPRSLPELDGLAGVHTLRNLADAAAIRAALLRRTRVLVLGGGFIGLEVAAAARAHGCEVTVAEAGRAPMGQVLGERLGGLIADWHRSHGVEVLCERTFAEAEPRPDGGLAVTLSDGTHLSAGLVVVAIGVRPEVGFLEGVEPSWDNGIACDLSGRTALADVFAAGDVAVPHVDGKPLRMGHWTPASDMARRVAGVLTGGEDDDRGLDDYFWSDQFGARLQLVGRIAPDAEMTIDTGAIDDWSFLARFHGGESGHEAVFAMNRARDFIRARLTMPGAAA